MTKNIDYYFTATSPFTWFGHQALLDLADKHGCDVIYKPMNIMEVWKVSGAVAPPQRPPVRQRYRIVELQRIAQRRGFSIIPQPASFPANPAPADLCALALIARGDNPGHFLGLVGEALWSKDQQVADEKILAELLEVAGHDAEAVISESKAQKLAEIRSANSRDAIEADVVGAPSYVYKGEVFWGQDRLDYLESMIETGRDAFSTKK